MLFGIMFNFTSVISLFFWSSETTSCETERGELNPAQVKWLPTLPFSSKSQCRNEKWEILKESLGPKGEDIEDKRKNENIDVN